MKEFKDRVAVITGAASGIGYSMAERFAAEGMKVVLADVGDAALARAESALQEKGAETLAVRTDVSKADDVNALAEKTIAAFGAVHIVCNNAGVTGGTDPVWKQPLESWQWTLGVNAWGIIHGIRAFVPIMLQQGTEGHIVNTSSGSGLFPAPPFSGPYVASKYAVVAISEVLHLELTLMCSKVKVSVLCPGYVRTNIMRTNYHNLPEKLKRSQPVSNEFEQKLFELSSKSLKAGIPPEQVAGDVIEAIRNEQFYIFPNPEVMKIVRNRMECILTQQNPTLQVPKEQWELLKKVYG